MGVSLCHQTTLKDRPNAQQSVTKNFKSMALLEVPCLTGPGYDFAFFSHCFLLSFILQVLYTYIMGFLNIH